MNVDALILFLVLVAGLLAITIFFYGGELVLHWLEKPASSQALASSAGQPVPGSTGAGAPDAIPAADRFDDDGSYQIS